MGGCTSKPKVLEGGKPTEAKALEKLVEEPLKVAMAVEEEGKDVSVAVAVSKEEVKKEEDWVSMAGDDQNGGGSRRRSLGNLFLKSTAEEEVDSYEDEGGKDSNVSEVKRVEQVETAVSASTEEQPKVVDAPGEEAKPAVLEVNSVVTAQKKPDQDQPGLFVEGKNAEKSEENKSEDFKADLQAAKDEASEQKSEEVKPDEDQKNAADEIIPVKISEAPNPSVEAENAERSSKLLKSDSAAENAEASAKTTEEVKQALEDENVELIPEKKLEVMTYTLGGKA